MSNVLVPGENASIDATEVKISLLCHGGGFVNHAIAVVPISRKDMPWLPLQDAPQPYAPGATSGLDFRIDLSVLDALTDRLLLVLYSSAGSVTLKGLSDVRITINGFVVDVDNADLAVSSIVFGELYRRNGVWRVRSKRDGVFEGIEELGRRIGVSIVDRRKNETPIDTRTQPEHGGSRGRKADWTGSGFLVGDRYLITNGHVVEKASEIQVSGFLGTTNAEPVIVDEMNDLALIRLDQSFGGSELFFREVGPILGEFAVTLGYPLSGLLGSGPQVSQGLVSGLLGPGEDSRLIQISAPIQPGSSGGPVFDSSGLLIGVVTATLVSGQNVNFAIRTGLAVALMEAVGIDVNAKPKSSARDLSELTKTNSKYVWRIECNA
ncbi:trypsin-like peptidase domain-containing protein [Mesorhizobium sp. M1076]|uniref:trypsin-like peptidase domain-containing protein n=1 Tax=Mesorhizobium sp. M1076 TaxID=2957054 RepID=UPI00333AD993